MRCYVIGKLDLDLRSPADLRKLLAHSNRKYTPTQFCHDITLGSLIASTFLLQKIINEVCHLAIHFV